MSEPRAFNFDDKSIATTYDDVLVPLLFEPWAIALLEECSDWEGRCVLDLATGTGVVAQRLAERVGARGKVIGADINREMLSLARRRCAGVIPAEDFIESSAHPLELGASAVDVIVCQQGFQFFPDRRVAAVEMYRVLRQEGRVIASTWRPVAECEFFGVICAALTDIEESEVADMMRVPFDFMPASELASHFTSAGFVNVEVTQRERDLVFPGGPKHAIDAAYATPIAPKLRALPDAKQVAFQNSMSERLDKLTDDGSTMGRMVSNVLSAEKPS